MKTDRQLLELLVDKVTGIEQEIGGIKQDVGELKQDVGELKQDVSGLKHKLEAVVEQTAGLLEFRTQVQIDIKELQDSGRSLASIVGEHEIHIRNLQRKIV